jgi:hypothetical protein
VEVCSQVKFQGNKLEKRLRQQRETVTLIESDGRERQRISPRWAADYILGGEFIAYGKNGVVTFVKAVGAPRRGNFAVAVRSSLRHFPRLRTVSKSPCNRLKWAQQPAASKNGHSGRVLAVHFRGGLQWV